jgi:hypothetical protein
VRAVYAASFELPSGTAPEQALDIAAGWFARGQAPVEIYTDWTQGRRSYRLPDDGHMLEVEVFESGAGRLWQGTWRHPHSSDHNLHMVSDVEIGIIGEAVTMSLVIRAVWARAKVAPPRFDMRAPRLPRTVVERFEVSDADRRLTATAHVLDAAAVMGFIDELLLNPTRTRPVVFISDDPRRMGPNVDPDGVARELAGLAHVFYSVYGHPGWQLGRRLGRLGCADGGVRIWWPGLTIEDDPMRHLLLAGHALRNWRGPDALSVLFRRISTAAAMNAAPATHPQLRRAGRRAQIAGATDVEARELLALALDDNERLTTELKSATDDCEMMELELGELADRLCAVEEEKEQLRRTYVGALAARGADPPADLTANDKSFASEEPELRSVRDAVDAVVDDCPHLAFADRAFESADASPFQRPELIRDALLKLERVAALWARPGGIGGMDLGQKATELGLDWKVDISDTAKNRRDYRFPWNGDKYTMGPHVRLGSGSGAGNIARIYLYRHEPDDPTSRRLVVAHVGRKLADTTTA